jgi:hypothetical protein
MLLRVMQEPAVVHSVVPVAPEQKRVLGVARLLLLYQRLEVRPVLRHVLAKLLDPLAQLGVGRRLGRGRLLLLLLLPHRVRPCLSRPKTKRKKSAYNFSFCFGVRMSTACLAGGD